MIVLSVPVADHNNYSLLLISVVNKFKFRALSFVVEGNYENILTTKFPDLRYIARHYVLKLL